MVPVRRDLRRLHGKPCSTLHTVKTIQREKGSVGRTYPAERGWRMRQAENQLAFFSSVCVPYLSAAAFSLAQLNLPAIYLSTLDRNRPVCDLVFCAIAGGGPTVTTLSPSSPPSGPRSIIQSALLMTSRLCSMIMIEPPASMSCLKAASNLLMSSK